MVQYSGGWKTGIVDPSLKGRILVGMRRPFGGRLEISGATTSRIIGQWNRLPQSIFWFPG